METSAPHGLYVLLPLETLEFPALAELTLSLAEKRTLGSTSIRYSDGNSILPRTVWMDRHKQMEGPNSVITAYLTHKNIAGIFHNKLDHLEEFAMLPTQHRICLILQDPVLARVALHSLPQNELPLSIPSLEAFKQEAGSCIVQGAVHFEKD